MYSNAALLDAIRRWTRLYGSPPSRSDWDPSRARGRCEPDVAAAMAERYRSGGWPSAATVRNRFGSFGAALTAAGVQAGPRPRVRWWDDEAILDALRDLAFERDRPPRPEDLLVGGAALPTADLVALRFGAWDAALAAAGLTQDNPRHDVLRGRQGSRPVSP